MSQSIISKENSCCFWIQHSGTAAKLKIGGASIVAALAAIAVVTGLLMVLAKQGFDLGCLNSIGQIVETHTLYSCFIISCALLLISIAALIALVRSYLNRTFSEEELNKLGMTGRIEKNHITEKMEPNTYWVVAGKKDKDSDTREVYALVIKNDKGKIEPIEGYKNKEDLKAHITSLGPNYSNGKKLFAESIKYSTNYIKSRFEQDVIRDHILTMKNDLPEGYHRYKQLEIPKTDGEIVHIFVSNANKQRTFHFVKDKCLEEFKTKQLQETIDIEEAEKATSNSRKRVPVVLKDKEYFTYDVKVEEKPLYAVSYRPHGSPEEKYHYYLKPDERDLYITEKLVGWTDAAKVSKDAKFYDPKVIPNICRKKERKKINQAVVGEHEFFPVNLKTRKRETIYAVKSVSNGRKESHYFKYEEDRKAHIQTLNNYIDREELDRQIEQVIQSENLANRCKKNEFFTAQLNDVRGIQLFAVIVKEGDKFKHQYYKTQQEATDATKAKGTLSQRGYTSLIEREKAIPLYFTLFVKNQLSEQIYQKFVDECGATRANEYWEEDIQSSDGSLTFYGLANGQEKVPFFFKTADERKKAIAASARLSRKEVEDKIQATIKQENLSEVAKKEKMYCKVEYKIRNKDLFVIIERRGENVFFPHFFPTHAERENFLKSNEAKGFVEIVPEIPTQYSEEVAKKMLSDEHWQFVYSAADRFAQSGSKICQRYDVPSKDKKRVVYCLAYNEKGLLSNTRQVRHFGSEAARQDFISSQLPAYLDTTLLTNAFYGVPPEMVGDERGIIESYHLENILINENDLCTFELHEQGKTHYAWVYRQNGQLNVLSTLDKKDFESSIAKSKNLTPFIQSIDHQALNTVTDALWKNKLIPLCCIHDCWLEENIEVSGKRVDILFFIKANKFYVHYFASAKGDANQFINKNKLQDSKKAFDASAEYPAKMGAHITELEWDKLHLSARESRIYPKEFWKLKVSKEHLKEKGYNNFEVFPVIIRDAKGAIHYRYFKTETARDNFLNNLTGYQNAFQRHDSAEKYAINAAPKAAGAKTACYMVVKDAKGQRAQFITVSLQNKKWTAASDYIEVTEVEKKAKALKDAALIPATDLI